MKHTDLKQNVQAGWGNFWYFHSNLMFISETFTFLMPHLASWWETEFKPLCIIPPPHSVSLKILRGFLNLTQSTSMVWNLFLQQLLLQWTFFPDTLGQHPQSCEDGLHDVLISWVGLWEPGCKCQHSQPSSMSLQPQR